MRGPVGRVLEAKPEAGLVNNPLDANGHQDISSVSAEKVSCKGLVSGSA